MHLQDTQAATLTRPENPLNPLDLSDYIVSVRTDRAIREGVENSGVYMNVIVGGAYMVRDCASASTPRSLP